MERFFRFLSAVPIVLILMAGTMAAQVSFAHTATLPVGTNPQTIATADFNGDGKADLATANLYGFSVSVMMGNGDGTFQPAVTYPLGDDNHPWAIVAVDVNGDNKPDLVFTSLTTDQNQTLRVLLNNGDGTFTTGVNYPLGDYPVSLVAGDFNHDGKVDIAVPDVVDQNVRVFLGNGDGTFRSPVITPVTEFPYAVAVGDLDGDGNLDLAFGGIYDNTVTVMLGNGDGTFRSQSLYTVGDSNSVSNIFGLVIADFNRDGKLDIATGNRGNPEASILLGNGDGSFQPPLGYAQFGLVWPTAAGDFNGDGKLDLVVAYGDGGDSMTVLLGDGTGNFQPGIDLPTASRPESLAVGDFNGDGKPDVAVANYNDNTVWIFTNTTVISDRGVMVSPPPGSTLTSTQVTFTWSPGSASTAYKLDIGKTPGGKEYFHSGNLGNVFTANTKNLPNDGSTVYVTLYSLVNGQWVSNSYTYTAWNVASSQAMMVIPVPGSQLTGPTMNFTWTAGVGATAYKLEVGSTPGAKDYYHSGSINALTTTANGLPTDGTVVYVTLYTQLNGKWYSTSYTYQAFLPIETHFLPAATYHTGTNPIAVAVGDFNRDGKLDLAVANAGNNNVGIMLGNGDGTFQSPMNYAVGARPYSVAVGDFNRDGKLDLVVANNSSGTVSVLLGNGDGTFQSAVNYHDNGSLETVVVGDFNNDGSPDLAVANAGNSNLGVFLGNGDGTFRTAVNYPAGGSLIESVAIGDFNGDGKPDLVATNGNNNRVSVLIGNGDGTFQAPAKYAVAGVPRGVAVGDLDGDGHPDLVVADNVSQLTSVLLNKGDGTFRKHVDYLAGPGERCVVVADFNGDGRPDLVFSNESSVTVSALEGNGDGTFRVAHAFQVGTGPAGMATGDFNGDGQLDLAVANWNSGTISILLNATKP